MPLDQNWITLIEHGSLAVIFGALFYWQRGRYESLQEKVDAEYRSRIEMLEKALDNCYSRIQALEAKNRASPMAD